MSSKIVNNKIPAVMNINILCLFNAINMLAGIPHIFEKNKLTIRI
jgi:hypothetical protein